MQMDTRLQWEGESKSHKAILGSVGNSLLLAEHWGHQTVTCVLSHAHTLDTLWPIRMVQLHVTRLLDNSCSDYIKLPLFLEISLVVST